MQNMSCSSKQKTLISTIMFDETNLSQAMCITLKAAMVKCEVPGTLGNRTIISFSGSLMFL